VTPVIRKIAVTAHIVSSVGWLGATAGFEVLAVVGLMSRDNVMAHAACLAMEPITWYVIIPLAFTSWLTGLVLALGTRWGLFRHYWVLAKFLLNTVAIIILLLHTRLIRVVAAAAAGQPWFRADLHELKIQLVAIGGGALLALLVATALAVFKPRGLTAYGRNARNP
jgi:hypothetical protein